MTMEMFKNYYQARVVDGCGIPHKFKLEKQRNVELYSLINNHSSQIVVRKADDYGIVWSSSRILNYIMEN